MDRARAKELIPIMQAYADGAQIEIEQASTKWRTIRAPKFTGGRNYRVKPHRNYRVKPQEMWLNQLKIKEPTWIRAYFSKHDAEQHAEGYERDHEFIAKRFIEAEENDNG